MGTAKIVGVFILSVALLSVALFFIFRYPAEKEGGEEVKGALPTWSTGNQWIYKNSAGDNYTYTVSGEENYDDTPCYRLEGTISPPFENWGPNVRRLYEKATLGLRSGTIYDSTRSQTSRYARSYSVDPWPISVGKTYAESVTFERRYLQGADTWSDTITYRTLNVTIEAFENVTVEAGTFESFRIVTRDSTDNNLVESRWYSDTVKNVVKLVNHQTGETLELSSY